MVRSRDAEYSSPCPPQMIFSTESACPESVTSQRPVRVFQILSNKTRTKMAVVRVAASNIEGAINEPGQYAAGVIILGWSANSGDSDRANAESARHRQPLVLILTICTPTRSIQEMLTFMSPSLDELASRSPAGFRCNGSHASDVTHCLWADRGWPCCCPLVGFHRRISPFLSADAKRFPVHQHKRQEHRTAGILMKSQKATAGGERTHNRYSSNVRSIGDLEMSDHERTLRTRQDAQQTQHDTLLCCMKPGRARQRDGAPLTVGRPGGAKDVVTVSSAREAR